jgi:acyl-CoA reductase-like NAD-dependent aldehyde dehydrogenase
MSNLTAKVMHYPINIPGAVKSGEPLNVYSPYDTRLLGTLDAIGHDGVEQALSNAHALFSDRAQWLSGEKRIAILTKTAQLMRQRADELAQVALNEGGKPLMDSNIEVARAIDGIENCIECIKSGAGREIPMGVSAASAGRLAFTSHEPIGVVVAVSAFNHPLNLIVHQVGPAIASGCPVIVKPSKDTPMSCFMLVDILREAGLPDAWCQPVVTQSAAVSEALVTDARVGFFSFIGSAGVGWMLRSKLAPGARCALEHGGVAPAIVAADADLNKALPALAKGGFYHAGQVCVSVQRIYVDNKIVSQVAQGLAELADKIVVGDPADSNTEIGPIIRGKELERVESWVNEAVAAGAEVLAGGKRISGSLYPPTVLLNPPADAKVSTKEVFGPVVCIYGYDDINEAIAQANSLEVAFQAAVFCQDLDIAMHAYRQLRASAVMVNDHTAFRVDWMPFAGLSTSGHGVGGIPATFEEMQIEKLLMIKSGAL